MNKAVIVAALVSLALFKVPQLHAAAGISGKGIVSTDQITVTATIEAIDPERRTVTLKSPEDKMLVLKVSRKVNKFDALKKGDVVSAGYLDAVAVIVRKPDGKSHPGYLHEVTIAPRGEDADGLPVDTVEMLGTVESVDHTGRKITVKDADGGTRTCKVDNRVAKFRYIMKGDQVSVRMTEPLAIEIKPVEK